MPINIKPMANNKLLAKIHIAKKELGLEDEIYRDILYRKFRVRSSKSLADSQAMVLINHFKALGWKEKSKRGNAPQNTGATCVGEPATKKYDDQKGDLYSASPQIKRKIEAMWHDLYRGNEETKHLRQWLFNRFRVSDINFLDKRTAYDAVEALKAMRRRRMPCESDSQMVG